MDKFPFKNYETMNVRWSKSVLVNSVTNLGKDDIGDTSARDHQEILTRKVYDALNKFMDPYVVYE